MKEIGFHRNVLSMLGYWVRSEPIMLILEYVPHGDLLQWLRNKRQQVRMYFYFVLVKCKLILPIDFQWLFRTEKLKEVGWKEGEVHCHTWSHPFKW